MTPDETMVVAGEEPVVPAEEPAPAKPPAKDLGWTLSGVLIVCGYVLAILAMLMAFRFDAPVFLVEGWMFLLPGLIFVAVMGGLSRPWTHLVAGLAAAVPAIIFLGLFFGWTALPDPTRGTESTVMYLMLWSFLWVFPAAFIGFALGLKEKPQGVRGSMKRSHGRYALMVGSFFFAMVIASILATLAIADADDAYDFEPDATVKITIEDFEFEPSTTTIKVGELTEIVVDNNDGAYHTFTYEAGSETYSHPVPGGQSVSFIVFFEEPGTITYWCEPHTMGEADDPDKDMMGTLEVEAA